MTIKAAINVELCNILYLLVRASGETILRHSKLREIRRSFVDMSGDNVGVPRPEFHVHLKRLVEAGYGKRIMFGSDQMVWPQAIEVAIDSITEAPFLPQQQKRDMLYNNAARFCG